MKIGVPREIKTMEYRVGLTPGAVRGLAAAGHEVRIQSGAGLGSGFADAEFADAGAKLVPCDEVWSASDLIVKVKEPQPSELALLEPRHVLFTYLHLAADKGLTEALVATGATSIAYETVHVGSRLPLLEPMSEVAGRMSVLVGAYFLAEHAGGRGTLLGGVPGVLPGCVTIIGGGTCGFNAAKIATGIGAETTILDVDGQRLSWLDMAMPAARTLYSTEAALVDLLPRTDLLIGAVLVPGARAPRLVTREMLRAMRPGTVFVDIAVDQGGCGETTRPTTHEQPTYVEERVTHYCVANMPGAYARTSTQALTSVTLPYLEALSTGGLADALERHPELEEGVNAHRGRLTCEEVALAHGLDWAALERA